MFFKLCSDHLSIEAIPRKATRVDLSKLEEGSILGHRILLWTPHFVVLQNQEGHEITLRRNGRMIIRKAESEELAKLSADAVMRLVQRVP